MLLSFRRFNPIVTADSIEIPEILQDLHKGKSALRIPEIKD